MINLLPTQLKQSIRYGRVNARLIRYLWLVGATSAVIMTIFAATALYLHSISAQSARDLATAQSGLSAYQSFKTTALATSQRLAAIKTIQSGQTRFSLLLSDLAKVLPQGTTLSGITLTGDASKPVQINVTADSYDHALAFRNALETSPRIAAVDLVSISPGAQGFTTTVVIAFKPGAAK